MKSKKRTNNQSTVILIILLISLVLTIVFYKQKSSRYLTQNKDFYSSRPNGRTLYYPTSTPLPPPRTVTNDTYQNKDLNISLFIPSGILLEEIYEENGLLNFLRIKDLEKLNITMFITQGKKIYGYEDPGQMSCNDIVINNTTLVVDDETVKRCRFTNEGKTSYFADIIHRDPEKPSALRISYSFTNTPTEKDFEKFDTLLSTIIFQ